MMMLFKTNETYTKTIHFLEKHSLIISASNAIIWWIIAIEKHIRGLMAHSMIYISWTIAMIALARSVVSFYRDFKNNNGTNKIE